MAKIQVYVNDHVSEKINVIAVQRRAEGAKEKDVSYSSNVCYKNRTMSTNREEANSVGRRA